MIITLGVWGATQYCAYELGHQENLGDPWFILFGYPVYIPWRVFEWTYYYEVYAKGVFATSYLFIYGSFAIEASFTGLYCGLEGKEK
ncbi:TRAG protein [methanotrophic endosymbiont of Bathymodiolus azoricus (Menez Gwen)]|nr:TRAG protein [methanotrophic endosymbiont of Bathymodiolus azoricus (Menez Gwen)]